MAGVIAGIDIGTSGCRVVVADSDLNIKRITSADYETTYPEPGMAVQDPEEILEGLFKCLKEALIDVGPVEGIVVGSCFHTLLLADDEIKPLDRLIPWLDTRATMQAKRIYAENIHTYKQTACPPSSAYPLAKLIWYRENQPDLLNKAAKVIGIKEYILFRLTGKLVVDQCVASGTGLFDIHKLKWDENSLKLAGISRNRMADVVPCVEQLSLAGEVSSIIGVPEGTPVIAGGGDGLMASLGVGAVEENDLAVMIGTSAACRKLVDKPITDETGKCRTWCYYLEDGIWAVGTSVNNGGIIFKWFLEHFCGDLLQHAENREAILQNFLNGLETLASKGIIFIPFLRSEREPFWDPDLRAEFSGINSDHTLSDLFQSALKGVNNLVFTMVSMVDEVAGPIDRILATGGFARFEPWVKDLTTLFGRSFHLPETREAAAYGACILGLRSLGRIERLNAVPVIESRVMQPVYSIVPERREEYERFYRYLIKKMKIAGEAAD